MDAVSVYVEDHVEYGFKHYMEVLSRYEFAPLC